MISTIFGDRNLSLSRPLLGKYKIFCLKYIQYVFHIAGNLLLRGLQSREKLNLSFQYWRFL